MNLIGTKFFNGIVGGQNRTPHKIDLIKANAARLGLKNVYTFLQDGTKVRETWAGKADYVLVDAPCSGLGVLNRRAEARWTKTEQDLAASPPLQQQILESQVYKK